MLLAGFGEQQRHITQGPGRGRQEPGFSPSMVEAMGGFYMEADLSCLLSPQIGYPAPGCYLAEELQENCECPKWGEVGRRRQRKLGVLGSGPFLSPKPFTDGSFARHFLNIHCALGVVLGTRQARSLPS